MLPRLVHLCSLWDGAVRVTSNVFHKYLLGVDTTAPSGLYARFCHAFLVVIDVFLSVPVRLIFYIVLCELRLILALLHEQVSDKNVLRPTVYRIGHFGEVAVMTLRAKVSSGLTTHGSHTASTAHLH